MSNVSVADILKMSGKWTRSKAFIILVSEKLGIGQRQAYRKIKDALREGEILRVGLPDRAVIFGLPEFGQVSNDQIKEQNFIKQLSKKDREERERMAKFYADSKYLGETYDTMKPLSDYAELLRKYRKAIGLEP